MLPSSGKITLADIAEELMIDYVDYQLNRNESYVLADKKPIGCPLLVPDDFYGKSFERNYLFYEQIDTIRTEDTKVYMFNIFNLGFKTIKSYTIDNTQQEYTIETIIDTVIGTAYFVVYGKRIDTTFDGVQRYKFPSSITIGIFGAVLPSAIRTKKYECKWKVSTGTGRDQSKTIEIKDIISAGQVPEAPADSYKATVGVDGVSYYRSIL